MSKLVHNVRKCGSCGGRNLGLPSDKAHGLYKRLLLAHKPWYDQCL